MKRILTPGRIILGVAAIAGMALLVALAWRPPTDSSSVASWVQAFGSIAAILLAVYLQHTASQERTNDQALARIQATNSAIALSGVACNLALALRRQHTQPAHDALLRAKKDLDDLLRQRATGQRQGNAPFVWEPDLSSFPAPVIPIEMLRELVVNDALPQGRAVGAVLQIEQAYVALRDSMTRRDLLAQRLATREIPKGMHHYYLLGLPLPDGGVNREFPDLVHSPAAFFPGSSAGDR